MFNPLTSHVMQQVRRYYEITSEGELIQWSQIESEFGPVTLRIGAFLRNYPARKNGWFDWLSVSCSSEDSDLFAFVVAELAFFVPVYQTFNPVTHFDYGLPSPSPDSLSSQD